MVGRHGKAGILYSVPFMNNSTSIYGSTEWYVILVIRFDRVRRTLFRIFWGVFERKGGGVHLLGPFGDTYLVGVI